MFNIDSLSVWIVTYNRPRAVNWAVVDWLASTPDHVPINVISNHSVLKLDRDYGPRVKVWMNNLRPDESWGYLARNWNQCFYLGLKDHEWVVCSQDDVRVGKGWVELVEEHPDYDFYTAPLFDVMFMLNRKAFRKVGWFDERFGIMEFHDNDYFRRVYQQLGPDRMSAVDKHGWLFNGKVQDFINPINLDKYWRNGVDEGYQKPDDHPRGRDVMHVRVNIRYLYEKWRAISKVNQQELNLRQRIGDIDWYPWFTKYIFEQAGEQYPEDRYLRRDGKEMVDNWMKRLGVRW